MRLSSCAVFPMGEVVFDDGVVEEVIFDTPEHPLIYSTHHGGLASN